MKSRFTVALTLPRLPGSGNLRYLEISEKTAACAPFLIDYSKVIVWRSMALQGEIGMVQICQLIKRKREEERRLWELLNFKNKMS
jgi:hypothetical protein